MEDSELSNASSKRKSLENMSKEELLTVLQKVRNQTLQIASDKKEALSKLEICQKEKDELRSKALAIMQRCKELEGENTLLGKQNSSNSTSDGADGTSAHSAVDDLKAQLEITQKELAKYKNATEKAMPKLKELSVIIDQKSEHEITLTTKLEEATLKVSVLEESLMSVQQEKALLESNMKIIKVQSQDEEEFKAKLISEQRTQNAKLMEEIDHLRKAGEMRAADMVHMKEQVQTLTTKNQSLLEELKQKKLENENFTKEKSKSTTDKESPLMEKEQSLIDEIKSLEVELKTTSSNLKEAEHQLKLAEAHCTDMENQLCSKDQELKQMKENSVIDNQLLAEKVTELESVANASSVSLKEAKSTISELTEKVRQSTQQIKELEMTIVEIQRTTVSKQELLDAQVTIDKMTAELRSKQLELEAVQAQISLSADEIDSKLTTKISELNQNIRETESLVIERNNTISDLNTDILAYKKNMESTENQLSLALEQNSILHKEVATHDNEMMTLKGDLASARQIIEEQLVCLNSLTDKVEQHQVEKERIKELADLNASMKFQVLETEKKLCQMYLKIDEDAKERGTLQNERQDLINNQNKLKLELSTVYSKLRNTEVQLAFAQEQCESLKNEVTICKQETEQAANERNMIRQEMENKLMEDNANCMNFSKAQEDHQKIIQVMSSELLETKSQLEIVLVELKEATQCSEVNENYLLKANELTEKLEKLSVESEELRSHLESTLQTLEINEVKLKDLQEQNNKFESEIAVRTKEFAELVEEKQMLREEIDRATEEIQSLTAKNADLQANQQRITQEMSMIVKSANERASAAVSKMKELKNTLESKTEALEFAKSHNSELQIKLESAGERQQEAVDEIRLQLMNIEEENASLLSQISELQQAASVTDELHAKIMEREDIILSLRNNISELETKLKEKDDLCNGLNKKNSSYQNVIDQLKAQLSKMEGEIKSITNQKLDLETSLEESKKSYNLMTGKIMSLQDTIASNESNIFHLQSLLDENNKALVETKDSFTLIKMELNEMKAQELSKQKPPQSFDVILRCSDGNRNWCLIRIPNDINSKDGDEEKSDLSIDISQINDEDGSKIEWKLEEEIISWYVKKDKEEEVGCFSIDIGSFEELDLPPTIQEELQTAFDIEMKDLQSQIEQLREEAKNSQQAFDRYRDRARASLLKTANEQQALESDLNKHKDYLKAEQARCSELEQALRKDKESLDKIQQDFDKARESYNVKVKELELLLSKAEAELAEIRQQVEENAKAAKETEYNAMESEEFVRLQRDIESLKAEVELSQQKERQIVTEMRKKSEAARQMIAAKDSEIDHLKAIMEKAKSEHQIESLKNATNSTNYQVVSNHPGGESQLRGSNNVGDLSLLLEMEEEHPVGGHPVADANSADVAQMINTISAVLKDNVEKETEQLQGDNGELDRIAALRKWNDLVGKVKSLMTEVHMLRSRQSLLGTPINASSRDSLTGSDGVAKDEREQRLIYLRQAFVGFVKAKHNSEMQNLGRVICAILALSPAEEASIMESISTIAPAVVASTTFGTLTSSFTNIFN